MKTYEPGYFQTFITHEVTQSAFSSAHFPMWQIQYVAKLFYVEVCFFSPLTGSFSLLLSADEITKQI